MRDEKVFILNLLQTQVGCPLASPWEEVRKWMCRYTSSWFTSCSCEVLSPNEFPVLQRLNAGGFTTQGEGGFPCERSCKKGQMHTQIHKYFFRNVLINAMSLNATG